MRTWIPFFPLAAWALILFALIRRKRTGQWKRPQTFRWAMILMTLAIVLSATAAVLKLYNL